MDRERMDSNVNCGPLEIVVTDLDGTLLRSDRTVSLFDKQTLCQLGEQDIIRVIATGRSLYSTQRVLAADFPIDFLIFSSGAGIVNWQNGRLMFDSEFTVKEVNFILDTLLPYDLNFMMHEAVPDNHQFLYRQVEKPHPDFLRRISLYKQYAMPLTVRRVVHRSSQFVAIVDQDLDLFKDLSEKLGDIASLIRATSPLDHQTMWIEIFPKNVSKGQAFKWLCKMIRINSEYSLGIGNDYNDWDLLQETAHSFVVDNAPEEMKRIFKATSDHNNSGFTQAVKALI